MNAETMALLLAKGLSAEDLLEVARAMEADKPRSAAAVRQKRYRDAKRNERDVTRDVTPPPIENNHTPCSVSDETGGEPPLDIVAQVFDLGVSLLKSQGHSERQSRSIVGSWRKGRNDGDVVAALADAKQRSISNLVEWMPKRLASKSTGPPSFLDVYSKEVERKAAQAH